MLDNVQCARGVPKSSQTYVPHVPYLMTPKFNEAMLASSITSSTGVLVVEAVIEVGGETTGEEDAPFLKSAQDPQDPTD